MPDESIFLLTEKQRAYFQRIKAEIYKGLQAEGIETKGGFTVEEDTLRQIAGALRNPAATYKKAHKALSERSFMIMRGDMKIAALEEYAQFFQDCPPDSETDAEAHAAHTAYLAEIRQRIETTSRRFFYLNGDKEQFRAIYREWFYLRSDTPQPFQTPVLFPIFPESEAYRLLESFDNGDPGYRIKNGKRVYAPEPWSFTPSPESLDALRNALGLPSFRYVALGDYTDLLFLDSYLKATVDALQHPQQEALSGIVDEPGTSGAEIMRVFAKPAEYIPLPVDKINNTLWGLISRPKDNGQIGVDLEALTSKKGRKKEAIVYAGITFDGTDGMKITRQIDPYDKRVYIAAGGLFNGGNSTFSASQIYREMGNEGQPSSADIQRINASLDKMGTARLYVDSTEETKVNKGYKSFKYDAPLLPFERVSAYIDNSLCDFAIHLFREPPLITFARERKQITQITRELLTSPISKTIANLTLEDYLLERIGRMKSDKSNANRKIAFDTVFEKCNITTKKQKQRAPKKIETYLTHYKKCGWIKGYQKDANGFLITP